jgi:hypothetical protein
VQYTKTLAGVTTAFYEFPVTHDVRRQSVETPTASQFRLQLARVVVVVGQLNETFEHDVKKLQ